MTTTQQAAAEIIAEIVLVQVAVEAHPAGTMILAAHLMINVAMIIIHHHRLEEAAVAEVAIGLKTVAAVADEALGISPVKPWDHHDQWLHEAQA